MKELRASLLELNLMTHRNDSKNSLVWKKYSTAYGTDNNHTRYGGQRRVFETTNIRGFKSLWSNSTATMAHLRDLKEKIKYAF